MFHGGVMYKILGHKVGNNPNEKIVPTTEFAEELQKRAQILLDKTRQNIMQSYSKDKDYYDRKAKAAPWKRRIFAF